MKYVIVIPDGCADDPQKELGSKTPLQAAKVPHMDRIAQQGVVGCSDNVPRPLNPASDVATLSLFGYDPLEVYTGRAPLEVAAMGIPLGPKDWAIRCNFITVEDGELRDFTAGHIDSDQGKDLIAALRNGIDGPVEGGTLELHAGVSYRNALIFRGDPKAPFTDDTITQPPHDVPDRPIQDHLPKGPGSELLCSLMEKSREILRDHPVNKARIEAGKRPATQVWLWGQGRAPTLEPFKKKYGKKGAIISAVDLVRGVGILLGWKRIDVEGATGYLDTDYAAKGRAAVEAIAQHDLVCVHIEAPDEASHEGLVQGKVEALEQIDHYIVGPLLEVLPSYGEWRILVEPDHRTTLETRAHAYGAVPFAIAGYGIEAGGASTYDEATAAQSPLQFAYGYKLMPWFLGQSTEN